MRKKHFFLSIAIVTLVSLVMVGFLSSCQKGRGRSNAIVEQIAPLPDALLPLLDSYTSGAIVPGDPVTVRFKDGVDLKLKYGDPLPTKIFSFQPALKGKPFWVDENTIGYQYDKLEDGRQYMGVFDISAFCDVPSGMNVQFCFAPRKQNFSLVEVIPFFDDDQKMGYRFKVAFSNPIDVEQALSVFDNALVKQYGLTAASSGVSDYIFEIKGLERKNKPYDITLAMDGKPIGCNTALKKALPIYAQDYFAPVLFDVNKTDGSASLYFSQNLKENQNLDGFFTFEPRIGYRTNIEGNRVDFFFDKSNMSYYQLESMKLTVEGGLNDETGRVLQEGNSYEFELTDDLPKVRWTNAGNIIPDDAGAKVYFDAVNLNSVTLRIVRIYDDNVLSFLQDNDMDDTYGIRKVGRLQKKIRLELDNPVPTRWKTFPIDLSQYVKVEPGAFYQLSLNFGPGDYAFATEEAKAAVAEDEELEKQYWDGQRYDYKKYRYDEDYDWNDPHGFSYYNDVEVRKNILISDLALTAKMGREDIVDVFVYQISDAIPASGAKVSAFDFQRQELATATADSDGHAVLNCARRPAFVVATDSRNNRSVIKTNNGNALSYSKFNVDGETVEKDVFGFAYTNRGVWRPGDELQLNLMLSDYDDQIPDNYPVVLEVFDATSRLYAKKVNTNPVGGIYCFTIPTKPSDETGLWKANFKVGSSIITKMLRVETVKPNRLEIGFDLPEVISTNSTKGVNLHAKWLNGLKASGLKAEVDVKLREGVTRFKNFPEYTFVNETGSFYQEEMSIFSGPLNGEGIATVGFAPLKGLKSSEMLDAVLTTKVFEPTGDFSIISTKAVVSPCASYVGVELPETQSKYGSFYDTGKDWKFNVAVVKENGSLSTTATALEYALYKLDSYWWWSSEDEYSLLRYANGTYRAPYENGKITCTGKTSLTFNIPDERWGNYLLVIDDKQNDNRFAKVISFDWGSSQIHASYGSGAPVQLAMLASAESYNVGDKVVVTFPANSKAKAMVTVEASNKVIASYYLDNLGTEGKVEFKATEEMIPNVYVYVSLLQAHDADNDMPIRMYGVVPVKIENKELELKPVVEVPESSNTNKKIEVKVKETKGKSMTYTLAVVDEGILGLTGFSTPDPYRYFNSKQALGVRTWDNYDYVVDAFSGDFGSVYAIGGDGIINQEIALDNRFKAYAVTLGPFELKAGGTNSHEFVVPQCSGALRFMVVAKSGEKSFGQGEKQMKVVDPITLYAAAPRVVAPGDELKLKVQVLSPVNKGKDLEVKVDNKNLISLANTPATVHIDQNGEGMVEMLVKVPETLGLATMKVTVSGGGYSAESKTEMPVRMPYAEKRQVFTKEVEGNQTVTLPFDLAGMKGTQSGNVSVGSLVPVDLFGHLDYLDAYPHGCLEQVTSKAFPKLYLNYFMQLTDEAQAKLGNDIASVISDLQAYRKSDNSMTNWKGGNYSDPWTEVYALHFLVEAQKQGFAVPSYFIDGLREYQANRAKQWRNNPDFKAGETIQAYRLFVLALADAPEMGALNRFKEIDMQYPLTKALAAAAFAQTGKTSIAKSLLPVVEEGKALSDYKATLGSQTRDLAFVTYAEMLCGVDKEQVKDHINQICGVLNSDRWLDTQSTALALFTLGRYAEINKLKGANIAANVTVNGEPHNLNSNMSMVGFDFVPAIGGNKVEIKNNSDQKVVAKVFTKTAVAEYETEEAGNFINMRVRYFDKNGLPVDPSTLAQGTDLNVQMTVENPSAYSVTELALSYYLPAGWEIVNDRVSGTDAFQGAKHVDIRDDRAYFYFDLMPQTKQTFNLKVNATFEGNYMIPAVRCEDMYNNEIYYVVPARGTVVK